MSSPHITLPWPYERIARKLNSISFFSQKVWQASNKILVQFFIYISHTQGLDWNYLENFTVLSLEGTRIFITENRRLRWRLQLSDFLSIPLDYTPRKIWLNFPNPPPIFPRLWVWDMINTIHLDVSMWSLLLIPILSEKWGEHPWCKICMKALKGVIWPPLPRVFY